MIRFPLFIPIFSLQCVHLNLICCYRQPALPLHLSRPRQQKRSPLLLCPMAIVAYLHGHLLRDVCSRWLYKLFEVGFTILVRNSQRACQSIHVSASELWRFFPAYELLTLFFPLLACNLLKGSVPATIPEDSDPCLVIWIFLVYVVST
jgi:hypothetical protein